MESTAIHLLVENKSVQELFSEVIRKRNVLGKPQDTIEAEDFFLVLFESGIRSRTAQDKNLKAFLSASEEEEDIFLFDRIK